MRSTNDNEAITRKLAVVSPEGANVSILWPCRGRRDGLAYVFERSESGSYETVARSVKRVPATDVLTWFVLTADMNEKYKDRQSEVYKAFLAQPMKEGQDLAGVWVTPDAAESSKPSKALRARRREHAAQFALFKRTYGNLEAMWHRVWVDDMRIADALERGNIQSARKLIGEHLRDPEQAQREARDPVAFLAGHFNNGLGETRFVTWRDGKDGMLKPGLYCFLPRQLAYAVLLARLGRPGSWSKCLRCGDHFQRKREGQLYCSHTCRSASAMRRYRANQEKFRQPK